MKKEPAPLMQELTIRWSESKDYKFEYQEDKARGMRQKRIYMGKFIGEAPEGLDTENQYCVKIISAIDSKSPQDREFYDLIDFRGDHLRQICAQNPTAERVANNIRVWGESRKPDGWLKCVSVEPCYIPIEELFAKNCPFSLYEKIDLIYQCALALKELTAPENRLGEWRIICHRDLKWGNVLLRISTGPEGKRSYRVCLIDFASIRLEGAPELAVNATSHHLGTDSTYKAPMSPSNTAPENLHGTDDEVNTWTDIYALGMMLGHLFLKEEGKPVSPSNRWGELHGWSKRNHYQTSCDEAMLAAAFEQCKRDYEKDAAWNNTWIEQSLAKPDSRTGSAPVVLQWDPEVPDNILKQIRILFFQSTRIDPKERPNLANFLASVRSLMKLIAREPTRERPVSVYLFDRTKFKENSQAYLRAAAEAFETEREEASCRDMPEPCALCVSYRHGTGHEWKVRDYANTEPGWLCRQPGELQKVISMIDTYNGDREKNTAIYGLQTAMQQLRALGDRFAFSGNVHIFTTEPPKLSAMERIQRGGKEYDMRTLYSRITRGNGGIRVYTTAGSARCADAEDWYSCVMLPGHIVPQGEPRSQQHREQSGRNWFYTGQNAWYILLEDGTKAYVGMKEGSWENEEIAYDR